MTVGMAEYNSENISEKQKTNHKVELQEWIVPK